MTDPAAIPQRGPVWRATASLAGFVRGRVVRRVGGPARARVITLFGAVLALSGADAATIGAAAPQLEHALHIGNTEIGLLSSVALFAGASVCAQLELLRAGGQHPVREDPGRPPGHVVEG